MPAEGAMQTRIEAPAQEPLSLAKTAVTVAGVRRAYRTRRGVVTALEGLDLEVREREVLAVVGPSGCGKSTLLELIAGLQEPDAGSVTAGGAREAEQRGGPRAPQPPGGPPPPPRPARADPRR